MVKSWNKSKKLLRLSSKVFLGFFNRRFLLRLEFIDGAVIRDILKPLLLLFLMLIPDALYALPMVADGLIYGILLLAFRRVDAEYLHSSRGRGPLTLRKVALLDVQTVHYPLDRHDLFLDFRDVSDGHYLGFHFLEFFDEALLEVGLEEFLFADDPAILV
jgi:hypothetical protein